MIPLNVQEAPALKWKRGKFQIAINPNAWRTEHATVPVDTGERTGWIYGPLAACESGLHWDITHLPTGRKVSDIPRTKQEAQELVEKLIRLADWSTPQPFKNISDLDMVFIRRLCTGLKVTS